MHLTPHSSWYPISAPSGDMTHRSHLCRGIRQPGHFLCAGGSYTNFIQFLCWWRVGSYLLNHIWLVVSTPLKNISQREALFPIYGKIKHVPNHQSDIESIGNEAVPNIETYHVWWCLMHRLFFLLWLCTTRSTSHTLGKKGRGVVYNLPLRDHSFKGSLHNDPFGKTHGVPSGKLT